MGSGVEEVSAIYEPMRPMGWIGEQPDDHELGWQTGIPIPDAWRDVVIDRTLDCGITVRAEQRGFTVYDFERWTPGVVQLADIKWPRTVGRITEKAKPALIQRLRVINTHLALMHSACVSMQNQTPAVMRVHSPDLYRIDHTDEGEPFWYRPLEDYLPAVVTVADRNRFGFIAVKTFNRSLDRLETVISGKALIEFDLLNQTVVALSAYDYALAVVAGWTVCELRTQVLARSAKIPTRKRTIFEICNDLTERGLISESLTPRLSQLRTRRNKWLHTGKEPTEGVAIEAVALAVELLRPVIVDLEVRPRHQSLIL